MFRFKKFSIAQEHAGMKVCTDACLFGAYIPLKTHKNLLDIGTGTGLLSLILSQKSSEIKVTAVEIEKNAIVDAKLNFENSVYKSQIALVEDSIQEFAKNSIQKFDLIISNPPFYQNNLTSPDQKRNAALHASTLTFEELAIAISKLLDQNGDCWILLPPFEMEAFEKTAKKYALFLNEKVAIRHNPQKQIFRNFGLFKTQKTNEIIESEINIYENEKYSPIFVNLLKDYYLIF